MLIAYPPVARSYASQVRANVREPRQQTFESPLRNDHLLPPQPARRQPRAARGALSQQRQPYRKGKTNGPRRKTGRGGGGDGGNAASLDGEISSGGAAACGSSGCWPGLSTLHDLMPS